MRGSWSSALGATPIGIEIAVPQPELLLESAGDPELESAPVDASTTQANTGASNGSWVRPHLVA